MLGEVSFCTRTLPNRLRNGAKELLLYLLFQSTDVTNIVFMGVWSWFLVLCHGIEVLKREGRGSENPFK